MAQKKKAIRKKKPSKYDEKFAINGTFEDVFKVIKQDLEDKTQESANKQRNTKKNKE